MAEEIDATCRGMGGAGRKSIRRRDGLFGLKRNSEEPASVREEGTEAEGGLD